MKSVTYFVTILSALFFIVCDNGKTSSYISDADLAAPQFVGNNSCAECHEVAFENWKGSDHDKAMDHATDSSVLGDFNDVVLISRGIESKFYRKDGHFYVYTNGPKGEMQEYKIEYTFGHWPLQQYLIQFENGRLQTLPLTWDSRRNKWYNMVDSVYADQDIPPNDWLYWTNNGQNWNGMCAECHSTKLEKGYDLATNGYNTTWSEINVSCEACHGPASNHLKLAEVEEEDRQEIPYTGFPSKSIGLNTEEMLNQCAFCHARRSSFDDFKHDGSHYLNQFLPHLVDENAYFFDGQIKEEDYVFTSFTQSRMHTRHVSCNDCHEPHNLQTKQQGNLLCLQCHNYEIYDNEEHHFHKKTGIGQSKESTANGFYDRGDGTQCVDCHMTGRVYMGVDFRRDHNFRIPRPDVSQRVGSPDACTSCHTDMKVAEVLDSLRKWYPGSYVGEDYGDLFYKIAKNDESAIGPLIPYLSDTSKSSMLRASGIEYISRTNSIEGMNAIANLLDNEDPLVRYSAINYTWNLNRELEIMALEDALSDSLKAIRIRAAVRLMTYDYNPSDSVKMKIFKEVEAEYISYLKYSADFAVSRHNLGVYYSNQGDVDAAVKELKAAIQIDDQYYPAMIELAVLYSQQGNNNLAEKWLSYTLDRNPEDRRALRYLALLKAELKEYDQSLKLFDRLVILEPNNSRNYYNMAFIYLEKNDFIAAELNYYKAINLDPSNIDYLYALAYHFVNSKQLNKAEQIARRMAELYPEQDATRQIFTLLASIK